MMTEITPGSEDDTKGEFYHILLDARSLRTAADAVDVTMPKWMGEAMRRTATEVERMVGMIQLMRIEHEFRPEGPSAPPENSAK